MLDTLFESTLTSVKLVKRGKVRDIYTADEEHLLIVATDRMSAFDVVLPSPIPGKGVVLTALSAFWFRRMAGVISNHLADIPLSTFLTADECRQVEGRGVIVRRLKPLPVEAIVRGYIVGSGWKDYQKTGTVCGLALPAGLQQAQRLPQPLFTPSTKAEVGEHDENVDFDYVVKEIGTELATQVRDVSLKIYSEAREHAAQRGIIIADTKLELGLDADERLVLIDEVLTPDSSRFWPADEYRTGISPPSFDKQYVRDYLETLDWDKTAPGPELPEKIVANTAAKYREAQRRLAE